jgi:hypothetical protein
MRATSGTVKSLGLVLPQQAGMVRRRSRLIDLAVTDDAVGAITAARDSSAPLVLVDHAERLRTGAERAALAELINACAADGRGLLVATADVDGLEPVLPASYLRLSLAPVSDRVLAGATA